MHPTNAPTAKVYSGVEHPLNISPIVRFTPSLLSCVVEGKDDNTNCEYSKDNSLGPGHTLLLS